MTGARTRELRHTAGDAPGSVPPPPASWRRYVCGAVAALLLLVAWGGLLSASTEEAQCEAEGGWLCGVVTLVWLIYITVPLTVMAVFFGSAAVMPFGTTRRVIIGIGTGISGSLLAVLASLMLLYSLAGDDAGDGAGPTFGLLIVSLLAFMGGFATAFAAAYRLAR